MYAQTIRTGGLGVVDAFARRGRELFVHILEQRQKQVDRMVKAHLRSFELDALHPLGQGDTDVTRADR